MDKTHYYGKVRTARVGEVPTHIATENIKLGDALVAQIADNLRYSAPRRVFIRTGGYQREPVRVIQIHVSTQTVRRSKGGLATGIILVVIAAALLWAAVARAETITYVAPDQIADTSKMVQAVVTAYTSSEDETDDRPFETAAGTLARAGVAACPSHYEFGTLVEIAGVEYVCEDRMNARYRDSEHFDVWVATKDEAFEFGRQTLSVITR